MAFENTMTEQDIDPATQQYLQSLRVDSSDMEPDLSVDGLSESILSRIVGLFGSRKN